MRKSRKSEASASRRTVASPLQGFGQSLLQVGGGCWERELNCDAAAVVEDGGQVVSFRGGQDGQLVVGLTCRRTHMPSAEQAFAWAESGRTLDFIHLCRDSPTFSQETNQIPENV